MLDNPQVAVIGAGPAGLAAAYGLLHQGLVPLVLEQRPQVGGISRTEQYQGYLFDLGGHRFITDLPAIQAIWEETLGQDLLRVERRSRIRYQGHWFQYPLEFNDVLAKLGLSESLRSIGSYLVAQLRPPQALADLESWLVHRFGRRLYRHFFQRYTEKIWGASCREMEADWANQRIPGLSLPAALMHTMGLGNSHPRNLTKQFHYPRLGAGMMWDKLQALIRAQGAALRLNSTAAGLRHQGGLIRGLEVRGKDASYWIAPEQVVSSLPLPQLVGLLDPPPPPEILRAAGQLKFRAFFEVALILEADQVFPDQWLYIHDPALLVGRVQNFQNWSPAMVPEAGFTSLGMEYFCTAGDHLWRRSDQEMIGLAVREMEVLWPRLAGKVIDGTVFRVSHAYPIYHLGYHSAVQTITQFLDGFANLKTIGRNGLHRYINLDQAMWSGLEAARVLGRGLAGVDVTSVPG